MGNSTASCDEDLVKMKDPDGWFQVFRPRKTHVALAKKLTVVHVSRLSDPCHARAKSHHRNAARPG